MNKMFVCVYFRKFVLVKIGYLILCVYFTRWYPIFRCVILFIIIFLKHYALVICKRKSAKGQKTSYSFVSRSKERL